MVLGVAVCLFLFCHKFVPFVSAGIVSGYYIFVSLNVDSYRSTRTAHFSRECFDAFSFMPLL